MRFHVSTPAELIRIATGDDLKSITADLKKLTGGVRPDQDEYVHVVWGDSKGVPATLSSGMGKEHYHNWPSYVTTYYSLQRLYDVFL